MGDPKKKTFTDKLLHLVKINHPHLRGVRTLFKEKARWDDPAYSRSVIEAYSRKFDRECLLVDWTALNKTHSYLQQQMHPVGP